MQIEWNEQKAKSNFVKHGVAFDVAARVFDDPRAVATFDRVIDGEERWRTVGRVGVATILFVAHTWLDQDGEIHVRIISARRADHQEIRAYDRGDERHFR